MLPVIAFNYFCNILLAVNIQGISIGSVIEIIIIIACLFFSAMMSGAEVAYFSLSPSDINLLKINPSAINKLILKHLAKPERLLATILVANNFVNISIIISFTLLTNSLISLSSSPFLAFFIQVISATLLILLFGEIIPKTYASRYTLSFATITAYPLLLTNQLFSPIIFLLEKSTILTNKKLLKRKHNITIDDISQALELTSGNIKEDEKILKGIVKFGNIEVKEIMKSRLDVVATDINIVYSQLLSLVTESGYSRIPIYSKSFDNIKGILYTKDLLPHLHKNDSFRWQSLIRPPYFVPETKKINELLQEFKFNRIHLAVIIDEYGGTTGIVTLEDILEEIVGEISDEFDEQELKYIKIDDFNYLFDGKTLLNDVEKILNISPDIFKNIKGEADTLAGLILELKGTLPLKGEKIFHGNFMFSIEQATNRRIEKIKITYLPNHTSKNE